MLVIASLISPEQFLSLTWLTYDSGYFCNTWEVWRAENWIRESLLNKVSIRCQLVYINLKSSSGPKDISERCVVQRESVLCLDDIFKKDFTLILIREGAINIRQNLKIYSDASKHSRSGVPVIC